MDGDNGSKITVGRHGTANDGDEIWVNLPCWRVNIEVKCNDLMLLLGL